MVVYDKRGNVVLDIAVDDNSYRYRELCGDSYVQLEYSMTEHIEIPLMSYVVVDGTRYTLIDAPKITSEHSRDFAYVARFVGDESLLRLYVFRNTVDSRTRFTFTGTPEEHLQLIINVLQKQGSGWAMGTCINGREKTISYERLSCREALELMAQEFDTEWESSNYTVSLRKIEYYKDNPLAVAYGKGKGLLPGVGRATFGDSKPLKAVYPQGSDRNINASEYGNPTLLLPKAQTLAFDGTFFEDGLGYDSSKGKTYQSSTDGTYVTGNTALTNIAEGMLDCTEIYPQREGTVSEVVIRDAEENFYDIVDSDIPSTLDYEAYRIAGEVMTIVFQSGMLAGREFSVQKYIHTSVDELPSRRFEIIPQDYDGVTMPGGDFMPAAGDAYKVFGVALPEAYISDNVNKVGASWDMMRKCIKHLYDYEKPQYSFTGQLDPSFVRDNDVYSRIRAGAYISFTNDNFQPTAVLMRVASVKDLINAPHKIEMTIKDSPLRSTLRLRDIQTSSNFNTRLLLQEREAMLAQTTAIEAQRMSSEAKTDSATAIEQASKASQSSTALSNQVTLLATRVGNTETDIEDIDERVSALETSGGGSGDGTSDANKLDKPSTQPDPRNVIIWDSTNNTVQGSGRELTENGLLQIQGFKDDSGHKYALPQSGLPDTDYDEMLATQDWVGDALVDKQDALTPSYGISISNDAISVNFSPAYFSIDSSSNSLILSGAIQESIGLGRDGYTIAQKSIHALDDMLGIKPRIRLYMPASGALSAAYIYAYHPYIQLVDSTAQLIVMRYNSKKNGRLDGQSHYKTSGGWSECHGAAIDSEIDVSPSAQGAVILQNGWQLYLPILDAICARAMLAKGLIDGYDEISMGQAMTLKGSDSALGILRVLYYGTFAPEKLFGNGHNRIKLGIALRVKNPAFYELYPDIDSATDSSAKRMWADNTPRYLYSNVAEIILSAGSHAARYPKLALKG